MNISPKKIEHIINKINETSAQYDTRETYHKIFTLVDFTTLATTDNTETVTAFINRANQFQQKYGLSVAAVCVFPNFISLSKQVLSDTSVKIAGVSAAFPTSQSFAEVKILETKIAIDAGADEIDVVMNIGKLQTNEYNVISEEIKTLKSICGKKHLKVILETSLLPDLQTVETAGTLALKAGADFIKTSTGKNGSTASLDAFIVMCHCVKNFYTQTGQKRGIKPAGGISTGSQALHYYLAVKFILGNDWLKPDLFRIGASSLINDLEKKMS